MSSRARRRRARPSATVKQAFEADDDDKKEHQEHTPGISDKHEASLPNPSLDKIGNVKVELNRLYERAFFTFNNTTVEVILNNDIISWSTVSIETLREDTNQKKTTEFDKIDSVNIQNVYAISPIYNQWNWSLNNNENQSGATVSTSMNNNVASSNPQLRGFRLHTYEKMEDNILREIFIFFQSDLSSQIEQWFELLSKIIAEYKPSRNILVICNPYAGSRDDRLMYNTKIKPLFDKTQHNITYLEINDSCPAEEVLSSFEGDFDSLYGLVIIGGDGSVINVINALIRYLAKENRTDLNAENALPPLPFPICIVPNGTTNIICHSIQGNIDHYTPILHLLFNQRMKIDMSAIFDVNYNFVTANFSAGAGYPANALKHFSRYLFFSPKKTIQKSFAKAASNKNLKSIEVEIRYIPADKTSISIARCYQGCPSCAQAAIEETDDLVKAFDNAHLEKINKRKKSVPLKNNSHGRAVSWERTSKRQTEQEKNWKILRHNYLQVAVLTNANLWSFAPQGLSKFGHLADGLLDLILIEQTTRKDFLRYVKRNGNSKNQYEFSFTNLIKVKEIEIELKLQNDDFVNDILSTDNQVDSSPSDDSSNEEHSNNNNNKPSNIQRHEPRPPNAPISDDNRRHRRRHHHITEQTQESSKHVLQSSKSVDTPTHLYSKNQNKQQSDNELDSPQIDTYGSNSSFRRKSIFQTLKLKKDKIPLPRPSSAQGSERDNEKQNRKNRRSAGGTLRPARSLLSLLTGGDSSSGKHDRPSSSHMKQDTSSTATNNGFKRSASVNSRSLSMDNEKIPTSAKNDFRKKKQPCMWNLDFTPYNSPLIRIKCFYRYLPVFGVGLNPDTKIKEVNHSCFGRIG